MKMDTKATRAWRTSPGKQGNRRWLAWLCWRMGFQVLRVRIYVLSLYKWKSLRTISIKASMLQAIPILIISLCRIPSGSSARPTAMTQKRSVSTLWNPAENYRVRGGLPLESSWFGYGLFHEIRCDIYKRVRTQAFTRRGLWGQRLVWTRSKKLPWREPWAFKTEQDKRQSYCRS